MSTRGDSYNGAFEVITLTKLQLSKRVLVYFPDPDNTFVGTYGPAWSWEIFNDTDSVIVQTGNQTSATEDYVTVTLSDPTYEVGKRYRVRIFDDSSALVDEWYFIVYSSDFVGLPPINVSQINDKLSRIAGLLGFNQVVTNVKHEMGVPVESQIELYDRDPTDPAAVLIGRYDQRKYLDLQGRVAGEVSARIT